jgi:hypothetical protein
VEEVVTKKAVLVGVNAYQPPIRPLKGCINDVLQLGDVLQRHYAFAEGDMKLLLNGDATRQRILDGLDWLVEGAQPDDVLVFHYSGHGSQVDDDSGDEWECRDEILVPYDHRWDQPLRDDHLKDRFDKVPLGTNLTIISDSCHSGTVNKLPTDTEAPRAILVPTEIQERIAAKVARRNAEYKAFAVAEYRRLARQLTPEELDARIEEFLAGALDRFRENRFRFVTTGESNILLAGCQDVQTSADAYIDGDWHGAFTYNLVRAILNAGAALTYAELVTEASRGMTQFQQTPQLECPDRLRDLLVFRPFPDQTQG